MKNKYYSLEDIKADCKYYFIIQARSTGKTLFAQRLRKAKELKENTHNEK